MTEKVLSYFFLLAGICYAVLANSLSFGMLTSPKAGFLPKITAVSAIVMLSLILSKQQYKTNQEETMHWRRFILLVAGLVFYLIGLLVVGYVLATFLVMLYLLKCVEMDGWVWPLMISLVVSSAFYGVFNGLLNVNLP